MANKKKKKNIFEQAIDETLANKKQNNMPVKQTTTTSTSPSTKDVVLGFLGDKLKVNDFKNIWSNGYDFGDIKKTIDTAKSIISPQEQIKQKVSSTITDLAQSDGKLFKENKAIKDTKDALKNTWSNGYQFGDIYKSKNAIQSGITKTILGTTADVGTNLLKGELQTAEGLVDTGRYVASDLVKWAGYNETAQGIRDRAIQNTTGFILGENDLYNNPVQDGWAKKIDEYSVFDQKLDQIGQSVGQQAFRIGLQKALMGKAPEGSATAKGVQAFNQLEIFAGSYGQAKSEAYMQGADDKTATTRGIISGTAEFISENLFDNVPGFKTSEMKSLTRLKDFIGSSTEKAMGKKAGQLITKFFGGFGEGVEEILSNALETTFTNVANYINPDYVYGMEEGQGIRDADNKVWKMFQDIYGSATSQESKDAFITSFFSTLITAGLTSSMNNKQRKQVINAYAQENNISTKQATELFDAIKDARLEQVVDEKTGYTERTELEEQATQQLVNEMQNNPKLNLEELFLATPKNRQESQFVFTNDERKNIKSEQQKVLANDLQRINNTKEVHDTYNIVNRVQAINKTQQYHLTTTEGLYEMGIVNKNENGDYIMPNGTPYVPRGLNYGTNGDIYVNVDVGTQSGTQAMYHEMFEGFKKASPEQYNEFKQMVTDIIGEENIQKEYDTYKTMYGEELTDDIRDEIINDKFGELAENQKFINRLADNRTLLEKIIDNVKNMVKYVKGTQQEKDLIKLQNKLEKEFAKRYKKTDFSQSEGETAYSLEDRVSGDKLLNTQDLINEIKSVGGKVDENGYVTLYHQTSNENAEKIKQTGKMTSKEDGVFFSTSKDAQQAQGRGETKLELKIPAEQLVLDDIFSDNADVKIPLNGETQLDVSNYLVDNQTSLNSKAVNNTAFSLTTNKDSNGRTLTKEQQEYFKDSKVVDEDGNLKVMYHGSQNDFSIFSKTFGGWYGDGYYFTDNRESGIDYAKGLKDNDGILYETYLNITNPYIHPADLINEDGSVTFAPSFREKFENDFKNDIPKNWNDIGRTEQDHQIKIILQKNGYDGINNGDVWVAFDSNQIKNVDNLNPTENADIRYSLTQRVDSELDDITEQQYNYFKNTKAVDQDGELEVVHHGTGADFNIFDIEKAGQTGLVFGNGFYFTNSSGNASMFAGDEGDVKSGYINIEKPASRDTKTMSYNEFKQLYNALNQNQNLYDEEMGMSNIDALLSDYGDIYSDKENVIKTFYDSYDNDVNLIDNLSYMSNPTEMYKTLRDTLGYDGIIVENPTGYDAFEKYYIAFNPDQFKLKTNQNPTNNVDMRLSLTRNDNIRSREIAPVNSTLIQEQLSNLTEQMDNLSNQIETLQNGLENSPRGYVETTNPGRYENQTYNAMTEEEANMYQDAITNDEAYMKSLSEQDIDTNANLIKTLTNNVQSKLDVNKYNRPRLEEVIRDAVENNLSSSEIADRLSPFSTYEETFEREGLKDVKKFVRESPIKVPDGVKRSIADYGKWKQSNFGKITFSNHGQGIDQVYSELCELYPEYFSEDIINEEDQLLRIAEVVNMSNVQTTTDQMDWDYIEDVADYISDYILNDRYNTQMESQASLDKDIQFDFTEDIAPTTIRSQESVDDYIENRDIAPVQKTEKQKSPYRQRVEKMFNTLQEMFVNRNHLIDEFSKATGNKNIKFAGDNLNNVSGETQFNVNSHQTDINGNWVGKGVHDIFAPARKAGLYNAFNDYLIQKSNIERHAVGKGSKVPLAVSQQLVQQYETENPQFKEWAKDVYKYFDNILQEQVDAGLITQEQYDNYRGEDGIYRSYVPFYEGEMDIKRFFDDDGNIRPYTTLKKSKGNADDVNKLLSVEESMARQTYAQKRAIRLNELYKQIVNSLDKYTEAMDIDIRNEPTNLDDNLYTNENGDKIVTAFVNGEKVSAIISDELYNELSQSNENRVKQLEQDFSLITNPLQKMSSVRRKLITTWNPVFLARNAIKDIQDAVINSKHTAGMLKNYYGLNKNHTPAIIELAQAKTQEAQQFLALYGSESTLGDYSKTNKFTKLNELIELAPRYAEFKASLEAGESVDEAIYNAREVTTNFGRGGYITKAMNRNGFTFLNANVQGLDKLFRNLSGQNGVKGVASVITKGALFAVLPSILNHMMYGGGDDDKDEAYEALPDYVKDNYYLIKLEDGNFLRIPKGRINAVFGSLARRMIETGQTGENELKGWADNAWSQIGVGDANGLQTIFTPINEAINNKAWHGGDIVPTRLQSKPAGEQSDEKTDYISKTLGELFNVSPKKINYVLDQYSGGLGDLLLPMITPASQNGAEGLEYLTSPVKDAFVVNSTDDNKYAGEFYDLKEELEVKKNGSNATDDDIIKYNYLSSVSSKMSDLYKEKREVQSDTELSNSEKYKKVQNIQNEINNLAKNALNDYKNVSGTDTFKQVGDTQYYKNNKNSWSKVSDSDDEFTAGMTQTEKASYFNTKNKISDIKSNDKLSYANKKEKITNAIVNSGLDDYSKAMLYAKNYSSEKKMNNVYNAGYDIDTYITAISDIDQLRDKYQVSKGYSVEFRKNKTIAYVNSLNIEIPQKAMLIREYYSSFKSYNNDIVNYVANLDLTYDEKKKILEGTGMKVKGNNVSWK